jgi:hypothetical protein
MTDNAVELSPETLKEVRLTDLIYFGYDDKLESEFINEFSCSFYGTVFTDQYDETKGNRQGICFTCESEKEYFMWIIAHGWNYASLNTCLLMMDNDRQEEIKEIINLAKIKYPHCLRE